MRLRGWKIHRRASPPSFHSGGERGMSLIEVLVALAIVALAGIAFLSGLTGIFQGVRVSQNRVTLESVAKSQMEYVKSQAYDDNLAHVPPQYLLLPDISGYTTTLNPPPQRLDPKNDGTANDDGIQQITVTVSHFDSLGHDTVLAVSDYKLKEE